MKSLLLTIFFVLFFASFVALSEAEDVTQRSINPEEWVLERRPGFGVDLSVGEEEDVSLTDAFNYLMYCWASYCTNYISDWNCQYCSENQVVSAFTPYLLITGDDLFAYVGYNDATQEIVAVFRGTVATDIQDWIDNLNTIQTSWDGYEYLQVHEGFYDAYLSISGGVHQGLMDVINLKPDYQLVVTGHSLGGAMAALCALNLTVNYGFQPIVYTFGSPRVGNPSFATFYNQQISVNYRFTNDDDIVPHVPPAVFGFQHVTQEVWDNGTVWFLCSATNGEDPYCADSVSVIDYSIADHLDYFNVELTC